MGVNSKVDVSHTYEELHHDHVNWLSQICYWKEQIRCLRNLCKKRSIYKTVPAWIYYAEIFNQLRHHERLLASMENQIYSHENFIKEMIGEDGVAPDEGMTDHDHNRDHIRNFARSFKSLKAWTYKLLEEKTAKN